MTVIRGEAFKILIASEDIRFRDILASKLRMENFDVEFAAGGFHLLHLIENNKDLHMLILNQDMDDMPAMEIIALTRLHKNKQELPILFVSKSNTEEEIYDLILTGANEYIVQTTNFKSIIERAYKYLQQIKSNAA